MTREQLRQAVVALRRDYVPGPRRAVQKRALDLLLARLDAGGRARLTHAQLGAALGRCKRQVQTIVHRVAAEVGLVIEATAGYANTYRLQLAGAAEPPFLASSSATWTPLAAESVPDLIQRWVTRLGGCLHGDVACAECAAHG